MPINFPPNVDTPIKRIMYVYRSKKRAIAIYNLLGKWKRGELTGDEYDNGIDGVMLPASVKNHFAFDSPPTDEQFRIIRERFLGKCQRVFDTFMGNVHKAMGLDTTFDSVIDDDAHEDD